MNRSTLLSATALLGLLAAPAVGAAVCRVTPQGSGNGTSWSSPMPLQSALAANACGEIWVRKGLYKPVVPANPVNVTHAERQVSFVIRPGSRVYGGFDGIACLVQVGAGRIARLDDHAAGEIDAEIQTACRQ